MKNIVRQLIERATSLPHNKTGKAFTIIGGIVGLTLLIGQASATLDVQTLLSNNVMYIEKILTTTNGLPGGTWKVNISKDGVKINISGTGVLKRDGEDFIVLSGVGSNDIASTTISGTQIVNQSLQNYNFAQNSITSRQIANGVITCDKIGIPGFNCNGSAGQVCPVNKVIQSISNTGALNCTGIVVGSASPIAGCADGQVYTWNGTSWACMAPSQSAADGSLWAISPSNSGDIYNKNYLSGNVGVQIQNPRTQLHNSGTFLVFSGGSINTGGWNSGGSSSGATIITTYSTGIGYLYYDEMVTTSSQFGYAYAMGLPACNCAPNGTGTMGQPNQPCTQWQMVAHFPWPTYNYSVPITGGSLIRFPFGYIAQPGVGRAVNDGNYHYQQDVGDFCRRTTPDYGGTAQVRRKYAQCSFPYNIGNPPPSAPVGGYRYTNRFANNYGLPNSSPAYASYVASCTPGGTPARIGTGATWTFTTGTYLGKVACAYDANTYRERYLDIPTTGYNEINPATCSYLTTGNVVIVTSISSGGGGGTSSINYYSGLACQSIGTLANFSGNHVVYVTGGNVGILTDNPQYNLDVNGIVRGAALQITSDARKKENVIRIPDALRRVLGIHGYTYTLKKDGTKHYGVIAQEVEEMFPYIIDTDTKGYKAVRYNALVGAIIEAIHTLDKRIHDTRTILDDNEIMLQSLEQTTKQ